MNQILIEKKRKLLEMLINKEITIEQFKKVLKIGLFCPIQLGNGINEQGIKLEKTPEQKEVESLFWIYTTLGENIIGITFDKE